MSITLDINGLDDILRAMPAKADKIMDACTKGMMKGMELFLGKIQREQMSGPTGQASVSVQTGYLRRNWYITNYEMAIGGRNVIVKMTALAPYALVHQTGSKDWDGTYPANVQNKYAWRKTLPDREKGAPRRHNIPKRLHIIEDYVQYGPNLLSTEIARQLQRVR